MGRLSHPQVTDRNVLVRKSLHGHVAGTQTVGASKLTFLMPEDGYLLGTDAYVGTAPTAANFIIDTLVDAVTVYTTPANRPTVAATTNASVEAAAPEVTSLPAGSLVTVDVIQVGATEAGVGLTVAIKYLASAAH